MKNLGEFSLKEVSELLKIPESKILSFEKKGILPDIMKNTNGKYILFKEDIICLNLIISFENLGVCDKEISRILKLAFNKEESLENRKKNLKNYHEKVFSKVKTLQEKIKKIDKSIPLCHINKLC